MSISRKPRNQTHFFFSFLFSVFQVTGDSIYNLVRLGDIETDKEDRPLDPPPRILSVEVAKHDP